MKRNLCLLCGISVLAAGLVSCNWQVPQKMSVKTNADYNFTVAKVDKDINEYLGKDKIKELSTDQMTVYDYNPEEKSDDLQQYLVKVPVKEIPLDFSQYVADLTQNAQEFSQTIKVPEVQFSKDIEISAESLKKQINKLVKFGGITGGDINVVDEGGAFRELRYESGTLKIYARGDVTSVALQHNGIPYAEANFRSLADPVTKTVAGYTFTLDKVAELNLAYASVYFSGMNISFTGTVAGFIGEVQEDAVLMGAYGLTLDEYALDLPAQNITNPFGTDFKKCKIGEGSLTGVVNTPAEWSNVSVKMDFETSGAVNVSTVNGTADLSGLEIVPADISVTPKIRILVRNGDIDFRKTAALKVSAEIKKIEEASINLGSTFEKSYSYSADIPSDVSDFVKKIWLGESELAGTYINGLPAGNDISFKANSVFLNLTDKSATIESGSETEKPFSIKTEADDIEGPGKATAGAKVDFRVDLELPGATASEPNLVTVKNVEAGKEYKISVKVTPKLEWLKMNLDASSASQKGTISTGINLQEMFGSITKELEDKTLTEKIKFKEFPLYIYCTKPELDIFDAITITGSIKAGTYNEATQKLDEAGKTDLITMNGTGSLFVNPPKLEMKEGTETVITDFKKAPNSGKKDLVTLMDTKGILGVEYDVTIGGTGGLEVTKAQFDQLKEKGTVNIGVVAYLSVPLAFRITEDISVDMMDFMDKQGDLFNRSEPTDIKDQEKYLDVIDSVKIGFRSYKVPFNYNNDQTISIKINLGLENVEEKIITLPTGEIRVSSDEVKKMMKTYPLKPACSVNLPAGEISIPRDKVFSMGLDLNLKTDGTIVLFGED